MSIKQNLETIKEEFKSDEKIFESAFKIERIFYRYKWIFIGIVAILLILWIYTSIKDMLEEKNAQQASKIYAQLQQQDTPELFEQLEKKAPNLAEFLYLRKAVQNGDEEALQKLSNSKNSFIAEFAKYQNAMLKKDINELGLINGQFGDLAKFEQAFLLIQDKKIAQAQEILQAIPQDSSIKELSKLLSHYGVQTPAKEKNQ